MSADRCVTLKLGDEVSAAGKGGTRSEGT